MKKISSLLIFVLLLVIACSSPQDPEDNTKRITLAERAGTYAGKLQIFDLNIKLDNNATVTSILVNEQESVIEPIKIPEGSDYTGTVIAPFDASVSLSGKSSPAKVKIIFKSSSDAAAGATAKVHIGAKPQDKFDEKKAVEAELKYSK